MHHLSHPRPWCGAAGAKHNEHEGNNKVYNSGFPEEKEKTPRCRIAELCRYHKIRPEYKLMDESGPAHKKMFTVQLVLSDEEKYEGVGGSIKKAQQNAAMAALKETKREMPPQRGDRNKKKGAPPSPIALLNNTLKQLSMKNPIYTRLESHLHPAGPYNQYSKMRHQNQPMFPQPPRVISAPPLPPRMCAVALTLDSRYPIIYGTAPTFHQAQSHCAVQALLLLGPALTQLEQENKEKNSVGRATVEVEEHCDKENNEDDSESDDTENGSNQQKGKSVVSKLHECALQLRMNVEFEIVAEEGPAHDKRYIISCKLAGPTGTCLHADGEGRNKKTAKQAACAALLDKIKDVEKFPLFIAQNLYKTHKKSSQPRDHKRKTIVKDKKMDPEYGHQINPVSRLMQVVQARGEAEPRFEFISEHGQCRYKEFVVEVTWGGMCCTGTGPNKRLAKRAAAEAMLSHIDRASIVEAVLAGQYRPFSEVDVSSLLPPPSALFYGGSSPGSPSSGSHFFVAPTTPSVVASTVPQNSAATTFINTAVSNPNPPTANPSAPTSSRLSTSALTPTPLVLPSQPLIPTPLYPSLATPSLVPSLPVAANKSSIPSVGSSATKLNIRPKSSVTHSDDVILSFDPLSSTNSNVSTSRSERSVPASIVRSSTTPHNAPAESSSVSRAEQMEVLYKEAFFSDRSQCDQMVGRCNGDVEKALKHLKMNYLVDMGIAKDLTQALSALENKGWNLNSAAETILS